MLMPCLMIVPAPRNPMPVITYATTRDGSSTTPVRLPNSISDHEKLPTMTKSVAPSPTSMCVRRPASWSRSSRSRPTAPASTTTMSIRTTPSQSGRSGPTRVPSGPRRGGGGAAHPRDLSTPSARSNGPRPEASRYRPPDDGSPTTPRRRPRRHARGSRRPRRPGPLRVHPRVARGGRRDRGRRRRRHRLLRRRGDDRRGRALRRARLHRRAHAPRVGEAPRRRVRAPRSPARDDRGRRRPARDRERPRQRRRPLAARRVGRPPARGLLHGAVVRARLGVRVPPAAARAGRPRGADAAEPRPRPGRDDELPRGHRRGSGRAREARARRSRARRRSCAGSSRQVTSRRTRRPGSARTTRLSRWRRGASAFAPGCGS